MAEAHIGSMKCGSIQWVLYAVSLSDGVDRDQRQGIRERQVSEGNS